MKQENNKKRSWENEINVRDLLMIPVVICLLSLVSCKTTMQAYYIDDNVKKIELGMTKEEVKSIAGNSYKILESYRQDDSIIDVWGYLDYMEGTYRLKFIDGILDSWDHEKKRVYYKEHHRNSSTSTTE